MRGAKVSFSRCDRLDLAPVARTLKRGKLTYCWRPKRCRVDTKDKKKGQFSQMTCNLTVPSHKHHSTHQAGGRSHSHPDEDRGDGTRTKSREAERDREGQSQPLPGDIFKTHTQSQARHCFKPTQGSFSRICWGPLTDEPAQSVCEARQCDSVLNCEAVESFVK